MSDDHPLIAGATPDAMGLESAAPVASAATTSAADTTQATSAALPMPAAEAQGRVLVVADDHSLGKRLTEALRAAGHAAVALRDLGVALPACDLLLLFSDHLTVEACTGARAMAERVGALLLVQLSSPSLPADISRLLTAGADVVLDGPPSETAVLAHACLLLRLGRGHGQVRRWTAQAAELERLAQELAVTVEPVQALQEATSRVVRTLGLERGAIHLFSLEDPDISYVVAATDDPGLSRFSVPLSKFPELRALVGSEEIRFIDDLGQGTLLGPFAELLAGKSQGSLVVVPFSLESRISGGLLLQGASPGRPLDEAGLAFARLAASTIALAFRDSRVLDGIRDQTRPFNLARYEAERRLRALDALRDFLESAADGMVVVDASGVVLYMNRAAELLTGYARSGLRGRTLDEVVVSAQREALLNIVSEVAAGTNFEGFDLQIITTSGDELMVSVATMTVLAEHGAAVLAFRDVSEARALERELRRTKEFLERLLNSTVDGIVAADSTGTIILFNSGAERLFGYQASEVVGEMDATRLYPAGVAQQVMQQLRSDQLGGPGRLNPSRYEVLSKSGEPIPVSLSAAILHDYDGREAATVGIYADLRERLRMEASLLRAQERLLASEKEAAIAGLAGTTAHELNQPLTSIMGYTELLQKRAALDESGRRAVETILKEADRMAEIVRKIGRITHYETKTYVGGTQILDLEKSSGRR